MLTHGRLISTVDPDEVAAESDDGSPGGSDQTRLLRSLSAKLDAFDHALLLLYLDDRPQREIADILGITEGNVATRLRRRLRDLAEDLSPAPTEQNHGHG